MPEIVTMPPQFTSTERPYLWVFTAKQTIILAIGIITAGAIAVYLPLNIGAVGKAVLGLSIFLFFLVGGIGKYHGTPLLVYFGSLLIFKYFTPQKYVKTGTLGTIQTMLQLPEQTHTHRSADDNRSDQMPKHGMQQA